MTLSMGRCRYAAWPSSIANHLTLEERAHGDHSAPPCAGYHNSACPSTCAAGGSRVAHPVMKRGRIMVTLGAIGRPPVERGICYDRQEMLENPRPHEPR
jgi:hypothetical protein